MPTARFLLVTLDLAELPVSSLSTCFAVLASEQTQARAAAVDVAMTISTARAVRCALHIAGNPNPDPKPKPSVCTKLTTRSSEMCEAFAAGCAIFEQIGAGVEEFAAASDVLNLEEFVAIATPGPFRNQAHKNARWQAAATAHPLLPIFQIQTALDLSLPSQPSAPPQLAF
eukprot:723984-Rhodomonas_salina.1